MSRQDAPRLSAGFRITGDELAATGFVGGYQGDYGDACGGLCFPGVLNVETEVMIFKTPPEASRFIARQRAVWGRLLGSEGPYGIEVTAVEPFFPGRLGEEAGGVRTRHAFPDGAISETMILFRVGDVISLVKVAVLAIERYPDGRAAAAARIVEERVEAVLARSG
jgi:hypothetical protein